jgi:threonine dehydratase
LGVDGWWFKCEFMQRTGTFKTRGAFNRILAARENGELDPAVGITVASGGNAGLANAYAAATLDVPATVYVPLTVPTLKVTRLRQLGATVVKHGAEYAEAYEAAIDHARSKGSVYCHAYDQPEIVAGAGTLATEMLAQIGEVDTIVVAVGGGGLMAGVAVAAAGASRVVGVEPHTAPTLRAALDAGGPVDVPVSGIAADSLGARRLGDVAYAAAVECGVRSVVVSDDDIVSARQRLWDDYRIVVEHGAAAGFAAVTSGAYQPADGERVAIVLCGANTYPGDL